MEPVSLVLAAQYGTPVLLLVLLGVSIWILRWLNDLSDSINDIKKGVVFMNVCEANRRTLDMTDAEHGRRLESIERKVFNGDGR